MKNYKNFIKELLINKENNSPLIEGIDIDIFNKTVSFNNISKISNIDVISIFKRKQNNIGSDGNPLIKALKNIDNWKFKNCEKDIKGLLKQFIKIVKKIENKYDTIIIVPSKNKLNTEFLHRLDNILKFDNKIEDYFHKLNVEEVLDNGIDRELLTKSTNFEYIWNDLIKSFEKMNNENNGFFSYKYIKPEYRKYICKTMSFDNDIIYENLINNKNILILDDTISTGQTISESVKNISEVFTPSKITVITLFSKL